MIPPSFSDLGKAARDLFDKKFKFGLIDIESTTSRDPINVKINGSHDLNTKGLNGSLEIKNKALYDIELLTKLSSKNVLSLEMNKSPTWLKGLKLGTVATYEPKSGDRTLKLKQSYQRDLVNFNSNLLFESLKPNVTMNVVLGCREPRNYLAGTEIVLSSKKCKVVSHTFGLSYHKSDFSVYGSVQNLSLLSGLVHQQVSKHSTIGVSISYNIKNKDLKYGLAAQYNIPESGSSFVKAKIDERSRLGLAYGTQVRDGVELSLCGEIDVKNFEGGPHNIGLGIVYEP